MDELFNKAEIEKINKEATGLVEQMSDTKVKTEDDLTDAKGILVNVSTAKKLLQAKKDGIVKPLNEALRQIRALFAPVEAKIAEAESGLKREILAYSNAVQAKVQAKQAEVAKKVESGQITLTKAAAQLEKGEQKTEAIPTRKVKEMEIVDEAQIPEEYWELNLIKLRKVALAGVAVPGVRVVEKTIIVSK